MLKKRLLALLLITVLAFGLVGCGNKGGETTDKPETNETEGTGESEETLDGEELSVGMVTDEGGVHDQSFNQSAWEGLQEAEKDLGVKVRYVESQDDADFTPNLEELLDGETNLMWGIGFKLADSVFEAATNNPDYKYAVVDASFDGNEEDYPGGTPENALGIVFKAEQPSFLVGYIAGKMTETDKVGFIGGIEIDVIQSFEYGYKAGVKFAAEELGKNIEVLSQYAESFSDAPKGKAIANQMYSQGADIVFHASGDVGTGVIEAAKENDKWVIGVDKDQNFLAPDHVLTSAVKRVDVAVYNTVKDLKEGNFKGGETVVYTLKEGGVDIAPSSDKHVPADLLEEVEALKQKIIDGDIEVPFNEETFKSF